MIVEELFEETIFPNLKQYVESNSIYSPIVTQDILEEYPMVYIKLLPVINQYNNLSYGEETYAFGINIDIYAKDATFDNNLVLKKEICDEITNVINNYFKNNFKMIIRLELNITNSDSSIYHNNVKVTGKLDTRYGLDKLMIYPLDDYKE